jgi:hypothetical protein
MTWPFLAYISQRYLKSKQARVQSDCVSVRTVKLLPWALYSHGLDADNPILYKALSTTLYYTVKYVGNAYKQIAAVFLEYICLFWNYWKSDIVRGSFIFVLFTTFKCMKWTTKDLFSLLRYKVDSFSSAVSI